MAEASVSFDLERLADLLDQIEDYKGLHREVERLQAELQWMQCFIKEGDAKQEDDEREDPAEDYLNVLIDRNMVQVAATSTDERVKQCQSHDLLRDFAISKAKTEKFLEILWNLRFMPPARSPGLWSLLFFRAYDQRPGSYSIPGNLPSLDSTSRDFKLLTVLALEDMKLCTVPRSIGKLIHLKYLGLRHNNLHELPSEIGDLSNLQTLDIAANFNLRIVPNAINKMRNLRHLYMLQGVEDAA